MTLFDVVVGLGANLGDRRQMLVRAVAGLQRLGRVVGVSALYETEPVGPPQPHYLNAAVRLKTELTPPELLARLLELERELGRVRRERWGPRVLDLDLLWVADFACDSQGLTVPHPELEQRAFALLPLLDVAAEASSLEGLSYRAISMSLDRSGVRELPGTREGWLLAPSNA
ncbi:MAG TPA: 2-amino-4-hydroxy-6-hydroxymethyldihydropteridine diphosphokinase [Polyangiaceae bacterium]|jgi:2-amino-4-hydroxy-6-hydroxymethyldihydropteridine diphosphokinase|nr:2-amino-4-hydroxy-6-hydroxymethyldihydropteridine diphosphokinase [Polyangiaceae bacterium]